MEMVQIQLKEWQEQYPVSTFSTVLHLKIPVCEVLVGGYQHIAET